MCGNISVVCNQQGVDASRDIHCGYIVLLRQVKERHLSHLHMRKQFISRPSLAPPFNHLQYAAQAGAREGLGMRLVHARELVKQQNQRERVHSSITCTYNRPTSDIPQQHTSEPVIQMCLSSMDSHQTTHVGEATQRNTLHYTKVIQFQFLRQV